MTRYDPASSGAAPSPCTGVCRIDADTGLCSGCLRTMDEIACWGSASEDRKREIWRAIRRREQAPPGSIKPDNAWR
jgi:predicted Fe-S protein YdhL (DUF1289 family)